MIKHEERLTGVDGRLCAVVKRAAAMVAFDITVSEGLRSKERQEQLVKEGKSKTLNSRHLTGHAVDLYPLAPSGVLDLTAFPALIVVMKQAAQELSVEIVCGADWKTFVDKPHFELKGEK